MQMHDPAHPGELLRKYLPQGMTISEIANRLGVTRQTLSALLNGRAGVNAEMALRLARRPTFGCGCNCSAIYGKPSKNRDAK